MRSPMLRWMVATLVAGLGWTAARLARAHCGEECWNPLPQWLSPATESGGGGCSTRARPGTPALVVLGGLLLRRRARR